MDMGFLSPKKLLEGFPRKLFRAGARFTTTTMDLAIASATVGIGIASDAVARHGSMGALSHASTSAKDSYGNQPTFHKEQSTRLGVVPSARRANGEAWSVLGLAKGSVRGQAGVPALQGGEVVMQKVGDVCELCRERWESKGKEPKVLKRVGSTMNKKMIVPGCEFCDGNLLAVAVLDNRMD